MSRTEGERKPVTVLFADIAGFTALAQRLDAEQLAETVNQFFSVLNGPINKYDGTIDKFMGDAVIVLFGAPRAHENDPERALRCAVEMIAAFESARKISARGQAFGLHIGINTGLVIAGEVGTERKVEYTVMGNAVNVASRLRDSAPIGAIYVNDVTYQLTQRLFQFRPVEPLEVKGKSERVAAYALEGVRAGAISARGIDGLHSPLVGRDAERAEMMDALSELGRRRGHVVFLVGEAGWGKSRLLSEVRAQVLVAQSLYFSIQWFEGRALAHTQNVAYFPIVDLFKRTVGSTHVHLTKDAQRKLEERLRDSMSPDLWNDISPFFKILLGIALDPISALKIKYLEAESRRRQTFYALRQAFRALAQRRSTVVAIDDLHWADDTTLEVLHYLLPLVEDVPLLFLFAIRPEEGQGAARLRDFVRAKYPQHFSEILLQPLTQAASRELLGNLLSAEHLPQDLRDIILTRAEGNPFYIEEVVRWLMEQKSIERTDGQWRVVAPMDALDLPPTLLGVIGARIDRLDPDLKETLQIAAVIGRTFSYALLRNVVPHPERLDEHLARLREMELVFEKKDPRRREYDFKHILTQGAAYESLLLRRRRELHRQVAQALEQFYGWRLEDRIAFLAHHYIRGDDASKAIDYAIKAAERARAVYTPQEAIKFYHLALSRMESDKVQDDARRAQILIGLGDAQSAQNNNDAALLNWEDALGLARAQNQFESVAGIQRRMGMASWIKGNTEAALKLYQEGLAGLDRLPFSGERTALYNEIGRLYFRIGDNEQAAHWAKQALRLGQALDAYEAIAQAYNTLGIATARTGEIEKGIEYVDKGLKVALDHDLLSAACRAYTNLGMMYAAVDHDKSVKYCEEGLELAKRIGDLSYQSWIQSALASNWCSLEGDWEQGIAAARASIELDRALGLRTHLAVPLILLAQIYQCHRQTNESEAHYREAQSIAEQVGDPQLLFPIYDGLAALSLDKGNNQLAEEYLAKSRQVATRSGYKGETLLVIPFLN